MKTEKIVGVNPTHAAMRLLAPGLHKVARMPNTDLNPALHYKLNENQFALEAAIMELTIWIEQQGLSDVGGNVRGALEVITQNEELINVSITTLMQPE